MQRKLAESERMMGNLQTRNRLLISAAAKPTVSQSRHSAGHDSYNLADEDDSEDEYQESDEDDWYSQPKSQHFQSYVGLSTIRYFIRNHNVLS